MKPPEPLQTPVSLKIQLVVEGNSYEVTMTAEHYLTPLWKDLVCLKFGHVELMTYKGLQKVLTQ